MLLTFSRNTTITIAKSIGWNKSPPFDTENESLEEIDKIIVKYENHPSMIKIKNKVNIVKRFRSTPVTGYDINKIIKSLPKSKKSSREIPLHILKENDFINLHSFSINRTIDQSAYMPKVFENPIFNQLPDYLDTFLAAYYVVFENDMGLNMLYSISQTNKKDSSMRKGMLHQY